MKLSLKLQDQPQSTTTATAATTNHHHHPLLLRAKLPITVFGLPFLSTLAANDHPSDLSLSLRTNFPTGPSLKLSYTPSTTANSAAAPPPPPPLTLTLKSGVSLFGSPNNSPLIISANFSFSPHNPSNPNPTFSLQFKPRLGSFSLRKSIFSNPKPSSNEIANGDAASSFGFVPLEKPTNNWKSFSVDSAGKDSILSGILVMANTELSVMKRVAVNFRWGVHLPNDYEKQFPYLRVNKIRIERLEEEHKDEVKEKGNESDFSMLKNMYSWMTSELHDLRKENREMKHELEEMRLRQHTHGHSVAGLGVGGGTRKMGQAVNNSGGFEQWKNKKKSAGEDNAQKDEKKNVSSTSGVESELQRAIMAASS